MRSIEAGIRISMAAMLLGGCARVEPKGKHNPADPPAVQAAELYMPTPTEVPAGTLPEMQVPDPSTFDTAPFLPDPTKEPEIDIYPFDATAGWKRFASVEIMPDGTRLFTKATPGDESYGVAPADLPPFEPWSAAYLKKVINWFDPTKSPRYQFGDSPYCNIWVWDVSRALLTELPHYVKDAYGEPTETDANWLYLWLSGKGADSGLPYWIWGKAADFGWEKISAQEAADYANQGIPVFAIEASPDLYKHGHITLVTPGDPVVLDGEIYPLVSGAGATPEIGESANSVFYYWITGQITGKPQEIEYYVKLKPGVFEHNGDGLAVTP